MSFLSKAFRRKSEGLPPWAALGHESLRISAAMEHVEKHGNLDDFPGNQSEKLALMLTASRQGLVQWNRARSTAQNRAPPDLQAAPRCRCASARCGG